MVSRSACSRSMPARAPWLPSSILWIRRTEMFLACACTSRISSAAADRPFPVGIVELEPRALERLDLINPDSIKINGAHLVTAHFKAVKIEDLIRPRSVVLERHVILKPRTPPAYNCHAQCDRHRAL